MTIRLGVYALPVDRDGLDYVIEAERLGVDSAWVPEFWGYDALTPLGAAAAVTDTIRLGTAVVQLGTRQTRSPDSRDHRDSSHGDGWIGDSFFCETADDVLTSTLTDVCR